MITDEQFRTAARKEVYRGTRWAWTKIKAGCPGAIAEARETAEYVRARLHPVAAKVAHSGRKRVCGATSTRGVRPEVSALIEQGDKDFGPTWNLLAEGP